MTEYNRALTPQQADFLALRADWRVAARDLGIALSEETEEMAHSKPQTEQKPSLVNA